MAIEYINCKSAEDFLACLRRCREYWWRNQEKTKPWVFRGVGDTNWRLLPSAWRDQRVNKLAPLIEKIKTQESFDWSFLEEEGFLTRLQTFNYNISKMTNTRLMYEWVLAETEALFQFTQKADRFGLEIEQANLDSPLKTGHVYELSIGYLNASIATLAQSYGIPTRFLEWTENPNLAAYFSSADKFRNKEAEDICVWAYNTDLFHSQDFSKPHVQILLPLKCKNTYLPTQRGIFTQLIGAEASFMNHGYWMSVEEAFSKWDTKEVILRNFTLPTSEVPKLLKVLNHEGINETEVMAGFDNIAESLIASWKYI